MSGLYVPRHETWDLYCLVLLVGPKCFCLVVVVLPGEGEGRTVGGCCQVWARYMAIIPEGRFKRCSCALCLCLALWVWGGGVGVNVGTVMPPRLEMEIEAPMGF